MYWDESDTTVCEFKKEAIGGQDAQHSLTLVTEMMIAVLATM